MSTADSANVVKAFFADMTTGGFDAALKHAHPNFTWWAAGAGEIQEQLPAIGALLAKNMKGPLSMKVHAMTAEGERVVTSAEANAFPPGLPVGVVRYSTSNVPEVVPFARLDRLEVVRLFDYGLKGVIPPEASVARQSERRR